MHRAAVPSLLGHDPPTPLARDAVLGDVAQAQGWRPVGRPVLAMSNRVITQLRTRRSG